MPTNEIVDKTIAFVKEKLKNAEAGHNWWHIERVLNNSRAIAANYSVNKQVIDLGALLHDIADAKFHDGNEGLGPKIATEFLNGLIKDETVIDKIISVIRYISFKNKNGKQPGFIEFKIIQDADRLDAIGAIGIARAFHFGGYKNREIFNPGILPVENPSDEAYKKNKGHTINHFYEKLLKIKDLMNTPEGKNMAGERHRFMLDYLKQFYSEWGINVPWK